MANLSADSTVVNHYVQRIYQAILDPNLIYDLVDDIRQTIEAPYGAFQIEDWVTHKLESGFLMNYDQKAIDQYAHYYIELDPWTQAGFKTLLNSFCGGHKLVRDKDYRDSEFYQDWGKENDVRHVIGTGFDMENGAVFKVSFQRHSTQSEFDQDIENFLNILHPHLEHFVQLTSLFQEQKNHASLWLNTLDTMSCPIWILDRNLRIIYSNHCAEEWMNKGSILTCRNGVMHTVNEKQQQVLQKMVACTSHILTSQSLMQSSMKSTNRKQWHHHRVVLGHHDKLENFWLSPFAYNDLLSNDGLVLMTGRKPVPETQQLTQGYGLTNRQAQLCALLMEGRALNEASQHLNISINTVRNILASCFGKLGVSNQSELIQLLFNGI